MDAILVLLQATLSFVALVLFYSFWSSRTNNFGDKKKLQAPKPNGAWPILGHLPLLGGTDPSFRILAKMADKYGPVLQIQLGLQHALVVSSKEAVMQIFTTNDISFLGRPKALGSKYVAYDGAFFALGPYGPFWREMRKDSIFELLSNSRLDVLKPVRTSEMIARKRYSSIGEGAMEMESRQFKRAYEDFFVLLGSFEMSNVILFTEWIDFNGNRRAMKRTAKKLDSILTSWLDEHKQQRVKQDQLNEDRDFIDVMLSMFAESDSSVYGHKNIDVIKGTVMSIIFAGADASTATLTWTLVLLLKHKEVLRKAQQELDLQIGQERLVEESDIKHLTYLQAIIKETLRLYPAAPLSIPREALEDCIVAGYNVPKGTQLMVNMWKLHRDPGTWTDPDEFQPERFLTIHAGVDVRGQQFEFIPFSSGRRSCPGMTAGMQMMQLTLSRLLQGFNVSTPTNEIVDMSEAAAITLHKKYPLDVVLTPRFGDKLYQEQEQEQIPSSLGFESNELKSQ